MQTEEKMNMLRRSLDSNSKVAFATKLSTSGCVRDTQLIRMCFECAVGFDHPLQVLVAPMRNGSATTTGSQSVNHTLGPGLVGCKFFATASIARIAGIALDLGQAHGER